jgi:hypothetical protein
MSEPFQPANTAELLTHIQAEYDRFEALLASLSEEQMTIPGVHGTWSVKDTLAHLTVWQDYQTTRLQGVLNGVEPPDPASGLEMKMPKTTLLSTIQRPTSGRGARTFSPILSTGYGCYRVSQLGGLKCSLPLVQQ